MKYASLINEPTPQTEPLSRRQVENNAGGFVFTLDNWARLERFLILGSDAPTYYQKAPDLTRENAQCVIACWDEDPARALDVITRISLEGRAPKNDPAIFALALGAAHQDQRVRQVALSGVVAVCRTGTHLFQFVKAARALGRGWGRSMKRAVGYWYNSKPIDALSYQLIKYREREGYSHRRLMQTAHPDPKAGHSGSTKDKEARIELYKWVWGKDVAAKKLPPLVQAHLEAMASVTTKRARIKLIQDHRLPWEAIPTECNSDPDYWEAQLPTVGLTALIRNLGSLSRIGLLKPLSEAEKVIAERLSDVGELKRARIHPFNVLVALKTYQSGRGFRGSNTWTPSQKIVSVLDKSFYTTFKNVEPSGRRFLFGLDVSGSMSSLMQGTNLSCCEAAAALALVTMNVEPRTYTFGFASSFVDLKIREGDTLEQATKKAQRSNFGSTDCSVAMAHALANKIEVDCFVVITDNETYAGRSHPSAVLQKYRRKMNPKAKLVVCGLTSTGFSIADPQDAGQLGCVGFDTSMPAVISDFARR